MPLAVALAVLVIGPWIAGRGTRAIGLPSILGMLFFGIAYAAVSGGIVPWLPGIPGEIDAVSGLIKTTALIVILLRAGLGIKKRVLADVGRSAIRMALIPCLVETAAATLAFIWIFEFDVVTALLGASILAAVSPAVVVPSMLDLKTMGYDRMPTLILAGASVDDAVAITIFTATLGISIGGGTLDARALLLFPVSIVSGIALGAGLGFAAAWFFRVNFAHIRATEKSLVLVVVSLLVVELGNVIPVAALLAVMTVGFVLLERAEEVAHEMAAKLSKLWVPAEILLFVLIGLAVDLPAAYDAGLRGLAVIGIGLAGRGIGVALALLPDRGLTRRERLFGLVAYLPKATVQAALGAIPLSFAIPGGIEILSVSVLSIITTAPLGLVLIRRLGPRLLGESPSPGKESS